MNNAKFVGIVMTVLVGLSWPGEALAQAAAPVTLEVVEMWIVKDVSAERMWNRTLEKNGIAFSMDAAMEDRLRQLGADDVWISVLRRARTAPASPEPARPTVDRAPSAQSPQVGRPPAQKPSFTRAQLRPMYFGNEARVTPYVSVLNLTETGGDVEGHYFGVALRTPKLEPSTMSYGLSFDYDVVGLDIEAAFPRDIKMLNVGVKLSPFVPLGTSGVRVIFSVRPFLGLVSQKLATLSTTSSDGSNAVTLQNVTGGGDISAGLAYHWRPGRWVFAEVGYMGMWTWSQSLNIPGREPITEGLPWPNWAAKGMTIRMGIGF